MTPMNQVLDMHRGAGPFGGGGEAAFWIFRGVLPFVTFLIVAGIVVWLIARTTGRPAPTFPGGTTAIDPALAELRLRYARGELSREEFTQRSTDLGGSAPTAGPAPS